MGHGYPRLLGFGMRGGPGCVRRAAASFVPLTAHAPRQAKLLLGAVPPLLPLGGQIHMPPLSMADPAPQHYQPLASTLSCLQVELVHAPGWVGQLALC